MKNIQELLGQLACKIEYEIQCNIKASFIKVHESIYYRNKIVNFQHNAENQNLQFQTEYIYKKNYTLPEEAINNIKNSDEYQAILEYKLKDKNIEIPLLDDFINFISYSFLNESNINESKINSIVDSFLKDINEEPFKCNANIELSGIQVKTAPIEFNIDKLKIVFRTVEFKDLEKEYIIYPYLHISLIDKRYEYTISAIVNVETYLDEEYEIQFEVEKTLAILRLFKVCSVKYISYNLDSEGIVQRRKLLGSYSNSKYLNHSSINKLEVTEDNKENFILFFKKLANIIPSNFYKLGIENKELVHLGIAYKHYCEALLSNSSLEERITKAVIGLESLILTENQEIAFRFCIRGAKILSLLNYSAIEVKKKLKVAYSIRSTFAHGDDIELEKEVSKLNTHYNSQQFLIEILDYLRVIIITIIVLSKQNSFVKTSREIVNFEKKKLLEIVDNSLIDKEQEKQLEDILKDVKLLISY